MKSKTQYFLIGIIVILVLGWGIGHYKQADNAKIQGEQCRQFFANSLSEAELNYNAFCEKVKDDAEISELLVHYNIIMSELTSANGQYVIGRENDFIEENEYYGEEAVVELQKQIMTCFETYTTYVENGRKNGDEFLSQYLTMEKEIQKIFRELKPEDI